MANYPSFPQLVGSTHTPFDDLQIDRSIDGTAYARAFYAARKDRFVLHHDLTLAQRDTLLAFYDANRAIPFDLLWTGDGTTYTNCLFNDLPKFSYLGKGYVHAEVPIERR